MTGPQPRAWHLAAARGAMADPGNRHGWQRLYVLAGASSILFVLLLILALVLDFLAPPPVHGGAATLEFIAANKANYVAEQILWILPNILPVLVFAALFAALSVFDKSLALVALICRGDHRREQHARRRRCPVRLRNLPDGTGHA
jgi:hypothetical protein